MSESPVGFWVVVLVTALLAGLLWRTYRGWSRRDQSRSFVLPHGAVLRPQPLLGEQDLLFYNLIRLAVQDRYLVFAGVPLWSFLAVEADGESRTDVLRHLALKRADFVLVHPGSRVVEQVVQVDQEPLVDAARGGTPEDIQRIVHAAGIRVTTLQAQLSYTIQELAQLLDVGDPD
jgi:hypothetical protein